MWEPSNEARPDEGLQMWKVTIVDGWRASIRKLAADAARV